MPAAVRDPGDVSTIPIGGGGSSCGIVKAEDHRRSLDLEHPSEKDLKQLEAIPSFPGAEVGPPK